MDGTTSGLMIAIGKREGQVLDMVKEMEMEREVKVVVTLPTLKI